MKSVGFFQGSRLVALKDLRLEWRTLETLASSMIFSMIVLVIFSFAFDMATVRKLGVARLVPGVIWTVLAFTAVVGMTRSFQFERRRGSLDALFLAPIDRSALFAGKFAANLFKMLVLQTLIIPISAIFFDYDLLAIVWRLAGIVLLHSFGLTALGTLFAAIATRVGRGETMMATLLFPTATPLFISAVKCTAALLDGRPLADVAGWLRLSAGFDLLYLFVALLTFEFVLED